METEFETKVLDIDVDEITRKLRELGAEEHEEILQRRHVYHLDDNRWIRLRDEGSAVKLVYKERMNTSISGTKETEVTVADFEKTAEILQHISTKEKYYQENKRKRFLLGKLDITIDTWPRIPPLLEIEGENEEAVKKGLQILGLEGRDSGQLPAPAVYKKYGIDLHSIPHLVFD